MNCRVCGAPASQPCAHVSDLTTTLHLSGEPQDRLSESERQLVHALSPQTALLLIQRGPSSGARFLLDSEEERVGRSSDSTIFLDDVSVSRRHALIRRSEAGFTVSDQGSLNGTYVNGKRVEVALLHDGDEVQIGKYRMVYFTGDFK